MNVLTGVHNTVILLVDDLPANISVLFEFLTGHGFKVLVAQDGQRALKKAEMVMPDLILLDVMMPGIDGFETCKRLKNNPQTAEIPIIFMTALTDVVDKVRGFEVGAADYITKPIQQEEVLARINTHLKLRRLQKQLQARSAESEAFARTVAHDLKNPLNIIINDSEDALEIYKQHCTTMNMEFIQLLERIQRTGRKMDKIINALLLLAGVAKMNNIPFEMISSDSMQHLVTQIVNERLGYLQKEKQAKIVLPEKWHAAVGYAPWVEEIWVNYLSNALKYGGDQPSIELGSSLSSDHRYVNFWVRDHGIGISEKAKKQLFVPFSRVNQENHIDIEGHGLGLSIVQQILDKLGGKASVESEEGKGSQFFFTLPATFST
jgi:signal transduction histidine kinase